jgi:hypothetical protein
MLVLTSSVQEGAAAVESIEEDAGLFSLHALRQPQPRRDLLHPGWWMVKMQFPFSSPLHFWILMLLCHEVVIGNKVSGMCKIFPIFFGFTV